MKTILILLLAGLLALSGTLARGGENTYATIGEVHRFAEGVDALVESGAAIEQLTGDEFTWSEGPVWVPQGGFLVFSDVPGNTAWKWSDSAGLEVFLKPSSMGGDRPGGPGTNGLVMSLDSYILAADHGSRSLLRIDPGSRQKQAIAREYGGMRFNSPNDLVVSRTRWPGTIFFTDPPYGLEGQDDSPLKEIDFNGIYRLDPGSEAVLLDATLPRPNGIALSPDERFLYVANSFRDNTVWRVYELDGQGGTKGAGRVFASAQEWADRGVRGLPDGMAVDVQGNVWATGPGGVFIISPSGEILGLIETGTRVANCAFGGEDGSVLYMTSHRFLARIQTLTHGVEFR